MARVMENHSKSLLPIPDVTSTTTRGFATQVRVLRASRKEAFLWRSRLESTGRSETSAEVLVGPPGGEAEGWSRTPVHSSGTKAVGR